MSEVKCGQCAKTWPKYDKRTIIIHFLDDHQVNLSFLPDSEIQMMIVKKESKADQLRCFLDGNALCVVKKGFVDPHESDAIFISLSDREIKLIQTFEEENRND